MCPCFLANSLAGPYLRGYQCRLLVLTEVDARTPYDLITVLLPSVFGVGSFVMLYGNYLDARKLDAGQKAELRYAAVSKVLSGASVSDVTLQYGLGEKTLYKWLNIYSAKGKDALLDVCSVGRKPCIDDDSMVHLVQILMDSYGQFWSKAMILKCLASQLNLHCSIATLNRCLSNLGLEFPEVSAPYSACMAGSMKTLSDDCLNLLTRRKKAERFYLVSSRYAANKRAMQDVGWFAFDSKRRIALYPCVSLFQVFQLIRSVTAQAKVIFVEEEFFYGDALSSDKHKVVVSPLCADMTVLSYQGKKSLPQPGT